MRENVIFKGEKDGVQLILNASAEFGVIIEQLKTKLEAASRFFTGGARVNIVCGGGVFSQEEKVRLIGLLGNYGLCCSVRGTCCEDRKEGSFVDEGVCEEEEADYYFADSSGALAQHMQTDSETHTLTVPKMLRGGQKIVYSGTVVVMGNVNPGAQVIAGGNIIIHGTCWGTLHAGAFGDSQATITADKLLAAQLRIAGLIARAPDKFHNPPYAETARVLNGKLVVEPVAACRRRTA